MLCAGNTKTLALLYSTLHELFSGCDVMSFLAQKVEVHQGDKTIIKTKPRIERNRVLVTGGAGFVGSHLCTYLVERGDHVSISSVKPPAGQRVPERPSYIDVHMERLQGR